MNHEGDARDDPARASALVAESVMALARAEIHLAVSSARAGGERLLVAIAAWVVAFLSLQAAVVVLVLSPVLWAFRPGPTLAAVALALGIASAASLWALRRWRLLTGAKRHVEVRHPGTSSRLERTQP